MILGVCEWLSPKIGISAGVLRLLFVFTVIFYGAGLGLYLILWLVKIISN